VNPLGNYITLVNKMLTKTVDIAYVPNYAWSLLLIVNILTD